MRCVRAAGSPHNQAVEVCSGVWAVPDGVELPHPAARAEDVSRRPELPGARRGNRLVQNVPCGMGDCTIDADGNLVEVDEAGGPVPRGVGPE